MERKAAGNKGFAIAGVTRFVDTLVLDRTVSLRRSGSANSPRHRKPPKRYATFLRKSVLKLNFYNKQNNNL